MSVYHDARSPECQIHFCCRLFFLQGVNIEGGLALYFIFIIYVLFKNTHSLTFWHRNYFFNFSTPCL